MDVRGLKITIGPKDWYTFMKADVNLCWAVQALNQPFGLPKN